MFLTLINILAIPQALVQTVFVVYMLVVGIILGINLWQLKTRQSIITAFKTLLIIVAVNAFWLLPSAYFTLHDVNVTKNAMNNRMNTERFFEVNKRRGTIADFAVLKEFYFDFQDIREDTNGLTFLMAPWRNHFENPLVPTIGYLFFGIILFGLLKKHPYRPYVIGLFVLSMAAFLSNTILFSEVNKLFRLLPLSSQIFRNPFTKFIVPAIFSFAVLFCFGLVFLSDYLKKKNIKQVALVGLLFLFVIYTYPLFTGNLFYKRVRVAIPQRYFDLFAYFHNQNKDARIMNLPQDSYWGWGSYSWGSVGSGFLWYGIEQPILDRAFDVWSDKLEGYYWELQYALKKRDQKLFNTVLTKYDVDYIIFDESYQPSDSMGIKYLLKQESLLDGNPLLTKEASFDSIRIYKRNNSAESQVIWYSDLPSVTADTQFMSRDVAYEEVGQYISPNQSSENTYFYPFAPLFSNRFPEEQPYSLNENSKSFILKSDLLSGKYQMTLPSWEDYETNIPVELLARKTGTNVDLTARVLYPRVTVGTQVLEPLENQFEFTTITDSDSVMITVNDNDVFSVSDLTEEYQYIGITHLENTPFGNTINIYSGTDREVSAIPPKAFGDAYPCTPPKDSYQVSSEKKRNEVVLKGNGTPVCVSVSESLDFGSKSSLIEMSFLYQSKKDELPIYCAFSNLIRDCVNKRDQLLFGFSPKMTQFKDFFSYSKDIHGPVNLSFILEPNSKTDEIDNITYGNVSLTSYALLESFSIEKIQVTPVQTYIVETYEPTDVTVEIPKIPLGAGTSSLISNNKYEFHHIAYNPLFSTDYYIQKLSGDQGVRLYAKDTFINFWLNLDDVNTASGSIISLESRRNRGFPLVLNVSTFSSNIKLVQTQNDVGDDFITQHYIVPPNYEFDDGYQILFNNASYNNGPTVHDLRDISVYQFPYNYLAHLSYRKFPIKEKSAASELLSASKLNTGLYTLNTPIKSGIITLSQSYHEGWKAYIVERETRNIKHLINTYFPFLFGKELKDHIIVNNWANGWKIDKDYLKSEIGNQKSTIIIVFWPQYLQFIGFGLLMITAILITTWATKHSD